MSALSPFADLLDRIESLPRITDDDDGEYVALEAVRSHITWAGLRVAFPEPVQRYTLTTDEQPGMELDPEGRWVLWEDVEP